MSSRACAGPRESEALSPADEVRFLRRKAGSLSTRLGLACDLGAGLHQSSVCFGIATVHAEDADSEWTNLAGKGEFVKVKEDLGKWLPKDNVPEAGGRNP